jgi:hypothetical protein
VIAWEDSSVTQTISFARALAAYGRDNFEGILKQEIEALGVDGLPLVKGLSGSNYVVGDKLQAMIISVTADARHVRVKAGIFFAGILTGCSCADDPTPVGEQNEYCELMFEIDRTSARATVALLS